MLTDFQTIIDDLLRDDANSITETQRDTAIVSAIARYSKDRPRSKVEDLVCASGGNYLDLPAAWEPEFSQLQSIEYPIGNVPPTFLANTDHDIYKAPNGEKIMLLNGVPINATLRVTYTISHVLSITEDTVKLGDREPLCCLAAASLCDQLASFYSGDTDSTIRADSVGHQSKAGEFASRAKSLRKRYQDELGIDAKRNVAAGVVVTLDKTNSQGGPRLTKRRNYNA